MKNLNLAIDLNSESLLALFDRDDKTNRLLAKHPNSNAELLVKLSHSSDKRTRQIVASNPNTPIETFIKLGQQFPKEFLTNPALDLLLLENPGLIEQMPQSLILRLLKQTDCPASLLNWGASNDSDKVQLAVGMNANAPNSALNRLRKSKYKSVRESVLAQSNQEMDLDLEKAFELAVRERIGSSGLEILTEAWLAGDIGLAQWCALPLTFRLGIASEKRKLTEYILPIFSPSGVARILIETKISLESIQKILPNYPGWGEIAEFDCIPHAIKFKLLEMLASSENWQYRAKAASNHLTPSSTLEKLAKDSDERVTYALQCNESAPKEFLNRIAIHSQDLQSLMRVASNSNTPPDALAVLAKNNSYQIRGRVAINQNTTPAVLAELSKNQEWEVRLAVASNINTSQDILGLLKFDGHEIVRIKAIKKTDAQKILSTSFVKNIESKSFKWEVAKNIDTPFETLELLSKDQAIDVRAEVSENPILPHHLIELLSDDIAEEVRMGVARNTTTPWPILEKLSKDQNEVVRRIVAGNPATPASVLEILSKENDRFIGRGLARNPSTPINILMKLSNHKSKYVLESLASQVHRENKLLKKLWNNTDIEIKSSVISCKLLTQAMLDELIKTTDFECELTLILEHPNLSRSSVEMIANKLLNTPAHESAWYKNELAKVTANLNQETYESALFSYHGKDPNKALLAKRPLAPIMALCSGSKIEPSKFTKVVGSSDWLIRAAMARNASAPPNIVNKLTKDVHPLVVALAKKAQTKNLQRP
jgi:hypothetical protein